MKNLLLPLLFIMFFLSCSKEKETVPVTPTIPLIKSISIDSTIVAEYWFDSQGRMTCSMTQSQGSNDSTVYIYNGSNIEKRSYYNGILAETEKGVLENGHLVSVHGVSSIAGTFWDIYYTYDEDGFLLREIHMDNDSVESWRIDYTVFDGNVISMTRTNYMAVTMTFEYYPETINSLGLLDQGQHMGKYSKNLKKSSLINYGLGSLQSNYSYEYYDNGWVKDMSMIIVTDTITMHFDYW